MSKYFSSKYDALVPYKPGEQPKDRFYVKLNTNESPYTPPKSIIESVKYKAHDLYLYSDPECTELTRELERFYGLEEGMVLVTNGSDEALDFAFKAYCDADHPIVFPDITYGFYPVFAKVNGIPYEEIPLRKNFTMDYRDYCGIHKNIVFANPNAPTGVAIPRFEVEEIVKSNPDNIIIVDEAYVDFGAESSIELVKHYDNVLVCQTFSKSRSLAGARVGYIMGNKELIADLHTLKYSTNPYNVNTMSQAAALTVLKDKTFLTNNGLAIAAERRFTTQELRKRGFTGTLSLANFLFVTTDRMPAGELYEKLRDKGVLVRHFSRPEITDYLRITVGKHKQMVILLKAIDEIFEEEGV